MADQINNNVVHFKYTNSTDILYAILRNVTLQARDVENSAWEDWTDGNILNYDFSSSTPTHGLWAGGFPDIDSGVYIYEIYKQEGATPAITDPCIAAMKGYWDGTNFLIGTNVQKIENSDATDQINAACDTAISDAALATAAKLLAYTQLIARKDAAIATDKATELAEINNDEGSGSGDYTNTTDSQEAIADATVAGGSLEFVPNSDSYITAGSQGASSYIDCASDNGVYWEITDDDTAAGLPTIDVTCAFNVGSNYIPAGLTIDGYFNRNGVGDYVVEIYVYNYASSAWDKLSIGTINTEMRDNSKDKLYLFSLSNTHKCPKTDGGDTKGDVRIRFKSTRTQTANGDVLYLDYVAVAAVSAGAVSPEILADAVWVKPTVDIRDGTNGTLLAGHILKRSVCLGTNVSATDSNISFTLADGIAVADAYVGMSIEVRDNSSSTRDICIRQVVSWTADRVITLDSALPFTPAVGDHVHICGFAYVSTEINKLLRADKVIDTTGDTYVVDYLEEGTSTTLMSKTMKTVANENITNVDAVLGRLEKE